MPKDSIISCNDPGGRLDVTKRTHAHDRQKADRRSILKRYSTWLNTGDPKTDAQIEAWLAKAGWKPGD